jgi:hypothetical protein
MQRQALQRHSWKLWPGALPCLVWLVVSLAVGPTKSAGRGRGTVSRNELNIIVGAGLEVKRGARPEHALPHGAQRRLNARHLEHRLERAQLGARQGGERRVRELWLSSKHASHHSMSAFMSLPSSVSAIAAQPSSDTQQSYMAARHSALRHARTASTQAGGVSAAWRQAAAACTGVCSCAPTSAHTSGASSTSLSASM